MQEIIKEINREGVRIPLEYRTDKNLAIQLISELKQSQEEVKNHQLYTLASWIGVELGRYKPNQQYSKVVAVGLRGLQETFDLHIPNGESYVANSIIAHNTVNLPNEVTEELVSQVYMEGWKAGCKGVTVYRDGSRGGVLISMDDKTTKVEFKDNHAIKRPKKVDADVIRFTNSGEKWIAFVGLVEGRPYEIFTGKVEDLSKIPNSVESGVIEKVKNEEGISSYIFSYKDGDKRISVGDIKVAFSKQWNDTTKFLSAILRHGIPIVQVVDILGKLNLDGDFITTWKAGIKRILKRYVAEGTKIEGKKCSDCGSQNIQFSDGCEKCMDCGSSKCG